MPFSLHAAGLSDIGLVRTNNEDVWATCDQEQFAVLADGMGGHQAGEVASQSAVNALCAIIKDTLIHKTPKIKTAPGHVRTLKLAIEEVNRVVWRMAQTDTSLKGMGTTLCCLQLYENLILWGHVGDSRIYRLHQGKFEQVTQDHSLVGQLVEIGQIAPNKEPKFLFKNILTKAIGTEPQIEPSVGALKAFDQDLYLLCSDGLTDLLTKDDIEEILQSTFNLEMIAQTLVETAKARGGHDNITVILCRIEENYAL